MFIHQHFHQTIFKTFFFYALRNVQNIVEAKMMLWQADLCYCQGTADAIVEDNKVRSLCGVRALTTLYERINVVIFMDFIFRDGK